MSDASNKWITFGERLPQIGDEIDIRFDDGRLFGRYGKVKSIINVASLPSTACIVAQASLDSQAWSLCSDQFVNSIVRGNYYWRKTGPWRLLNV